MKKVKDEIRRLKLEKVVVKNIDLAPNDLFDFYKMVESIMMRDIGPSSKDLKTMRDIIDILSVYNIFLEISSISIKYCA